MTTPRRLLAYGRWSGCDGDPGLLGSVVHPHGDRHNPGGACLKQGASRTLPGVSHLGKHRDTLRPPWLDLKSDRKVVNRLPARVAHGDGQFCCVPPEDERGGGVQREEIPSRRGTDELWRTRQAAADYQQAKEQDHMPRVDGGTRLGSQGVISRDTSGARV